jgi:threonine synthase
MPFQLQYQKLLQYYSEKASDSKSMHLCCIVCGKEHFDFRINRCTECQGALDIIYNLSESKIVSSYNPLERYFPLLPIQQKKNLLWLGEGNTPCIHAKDLGNYLGMSQLYLKDETANPTRSTKDRIASVGLSRFKELGLKSLVIASTGNSSTAYARGVQLIGGFELHVFVARDFLARLNYFDHPNVKTYVVEDDFVSAGSAAKEFAAQEKSFFEGGFFSLSRREGLKLTYLEAFDQMPEPPEYIFQAVSSGMGLLGAYKGILEYQFLGRLSLTPRLIGVQQSSCSPIADAYNDGAETIQPQHIIKRPTGIASAILRGDPSQSYPYIRHICHATDGHILSTGEAEIRKAQQILFDHEGIRACFASSTALAGLIRMKEQHMLNADAPILVNLTGGDRAFAPTPQQTIDYSLAGSR